MLLGCSYLKVRLNRACVGSCVFVICKSMAIRIETKLLASSSDAVCNYWSEHRWELIKCLIDTIETRHALPCDIQTNKNTSGRINNSVARDQSRRPPGRVVACGLQGFGCNPNSCLETVVATVNLRYIHVMASTTDSDQTFRTHVHTHVHSIVAHFSTCHFILLT